MPRIAVNLTMLFTEYPLIDRFERAARSGFEAVEVQFPYEIDPTEITRRLRDNGLELVLFNLPAGDWPAGDRGLAADPDRRAEFRDGVDLALAWATALRVPRVNCLVGKTPDKAASRQNLLENVQHAADLMATIGTKLLIEPVNSHDMNDFAVNTTQEGLDLIAELGHPNIGLQYDVYHALRMEEDPYATLAEHGASIAHIQVADVPGRHQPGTGDIDWNRLFAAIDDSGFDGWVGLEYIPEGHTEEGFDLVRDLDLLGPRRDA